MFILTKTGRHGDLDLCDVELTVLLDAERVDIKLKVWSTFLSTQYLDIFFVSISVLHKMCVNPAYLIYGECERFFLFFLGGGGYTFKPVDGSVPYSAVLHRL